MRDDRGQEIQRQLAQSRHRMYKAEPERARPLGSHQSVGEAPLERGWVGSVQAAVPSWSNEEAPYLITWGDEPGSGGRGGSTKIWLAVAAVLLALLVVIAAGLSLLDAMESSRALEAVRLRTLVSVISKASGQAPRLGNSLASQDQPRVEAPTPVAWPTYTPLPTDTPIPTATVEPTATPSPTSTPTDTPVPSATPTDTPLPPTATPSPPPTSTPPLPSPTPTESVAEAVSMSSLESVAPVAVWDGRLDQLRVRLRDASIPPERPYWRLVEARWADETEAEGRHNIYVNVLDENGERMVGQPVVVEWQDGREARATQTKPQPEYSFVFNMYGVLGSYDVYLQGLPSDALVGAGLGDLARPTWKIHTCFYLTFQRTVR